MLKNKSSLGFIPAYYSPGMTERYLFLLDKLNFEKKNRENFKLLGNYKAFFLTDNHKILFYLKVLFHCILNNKIKIIYYCTEMYFISYNAAVSESINNKLSLGNLRALVERLFQILVIKIINVLSNLLIIHCNQSRQVYSSIKQSLYINNFPFKSEVLNPQKKKINSVKYAYLPGNFNCEFELQKICDFCKSENINLVISTSKKFSSDFWTRNKNIIELTGVITTKEVLYLTLNCVYGVCIYNKKNINQNFASSLKALLFLSLKKKIIYSNVKGNLFMKNYYGCFNTDNLLLVNGYDNRKRYNPNYFDDFIKDSKYEILKNFLNF